MKVDIFDPVDFMPHGTCNIAAAVLGAGALTAGASAFGASSAADAQRDAAGNASALQYKMFKKAYNLISPYAEAGSDMLPTLQGYINPNSSTSPLAALLKLTMPGADMSATLEQTPGYEFTQRMGQKAVTNALAARGLAGPGGPLARASADYASGLASNTWQSVVDKLMNVYGSGATALQNLVNTGSGAASSLGNAATNTGSQIGQNMIGAGNASAAGIMGTANAVGGFGSSVMNASILDKLLGGGGGGIYASAANPGL
jgi:hypothetical protein